MSELTKRHHTRLQGNHEHILHIVHNGHYYNIPKKIAVKYEDKSKVVRAVPPKDIFADLEKKYTKAGVLLRGTRHREGLTQTEMAKKINVTQADLSKMENGKRPIGKIVAKRIEKMFGVNYRYFL
jgi:ribosome-binding protein aMBF1 (putative translation factor)